MLGVPPVFAKCRLRFLYIIPQAEFFVTGYTPTLRNLVPFFAPLKKLKNISEKKHTCTHNRPHKMPCGIASQSRMADWLSAHKPESFTPGIVHGDYHLSNVMFRPDGPELAAIVDWELASVGDPLVDLGWVVATWPDPTGPVQGTVGAEPWTGFPTAAELVEHYGRRSARDLSRIRWYVVLACFRLGILVEGTYARSFSGKADPIIGERLHSQAVFLFERAANLILGNRTLSTID
jgi:hypothetical protein